MDWLLQLASKVGGSVFIIAFIIFLAFIFYIIGLLVKHRKDIKGAIESWIEREKEKEELKRTVEQNNKDIKALKEKTDTYCDNRVHDREQSFKIQEELNGAITGIKDVLSELTQLNATKDKQINNLIVAQKEMLAEKINEKYKYYLSIGGIPEDEYDEFVSLHSAYKGVGGNHHGDAKFEYCINHLPVIPVETKLVTKDD